MCQVVPPLVVVFARIPHLRPAGERCYSLLAVLLLTCVTLLCGYRFKATITG